MAIEAAAPKAPQPHGQAGPRHQEHAKHEDGAGRGPKPEAALPISPKARRDLARPALKRAAGARRADRAGHNLQYRQWHVWRGFRREGP